MATDDELIANRLSSAALEIGQYLDNHSVARSIFMMDVLTSDQLPRYEIGIDTVYFHTGTEVVECGGMPDSGFVDWKEVKKDRGGLEFVVPIFETGVQTAFGTTNHEMEYAKYSAKKSLREKEEKLAFDLLENLNQVTKCKKTTLDRGAHDAFRKIEQHDLIVNTIIVNKSGFEDLCNYLSPVVTVASETERQYNNCWGRLWTAKIMVAESSRLNRRAYLVSEPDRFGAMPIGSCVQFRQTAKRSGFANHRNGMAIINSFAGAVLELEF